ncbi:hypothetical protein C8J57DRAFT_1283728 [Mycena rebaudengoi]|nr:hypothetical protein C8J57DRAFT_1283728 [Mycena rebaudengoi]
MEGAYAQSPAVPRLRVSRQPQTTAPDRPPSQEESKAGPSRPRDHSGADHPNGDAARDDDHLPTPKGVNPGSNASPPVEAAARLRALLSRIPNEPKTSVARPVSPSEVESDFDPPRFSPTTPSARQSLTDMFSRAMHDTPVKNRDTPGKNRPRRNSFDTSEVEASPRVRERAKNKGKRKSLSDEEAEKPSRSLRSEASFRSQAATFDILRERLTNSHTALKNQAVPTLYEHSSADETHDTATFLRDLNSSRATPPVATSTPPHSMEMSTNSKYQSNLMGDDSEMQSMMKGLDSFGDSPSQPISFPPSRGKPAGPGSVRPHQSTSQSHRLSHSASRPSSQIGTNSITNGHHDQPDHIRELEREWNKPHHKAPPKPERHYSHGAAGNRSQSPTVVLNDRPVRTRTRSSASNHSVEDDGSSKGTSFGSQSDYKERIRELENERNHEREHGWNKPHVARSTSNLSVHSPVQRPHSPMPTDKPHVTRPTSTLGVHSPVQRPHSPMPTERSRKLSHPSRPGSSHSLLPPEKPRPHSAASSRTSSDEEEEIKHEIEHERERNWGAPIPRWHQHPSIGHHHHSHHRSPSPLPPSPASASTSSHPHSTARVRAESLRAGGTVKGDTPLHRSESLRSTPNTTKTSTLAPLSQPQARPKSTLSASSGRPRPVSYPARPNSPLPPIERKPRPISTTSTSFKPASPPHSRSPERDRGLSRIPASPSPSPGKKLANRSSMSHIPVRSKQNQNSSSGTMNGHSMTNGHSRMPAESRQEDVVPPDSPQHESRDSVSQGQHEDPFTETDVEEHQEEHLPDDNTPTLDNAATPAGAVDPHPTVASSSQLAADNEDVLPIDTALPPSPVPSPSTPTAAEPTTILGLLATPPKRPSFSSSRLEFQTPSPPRGLPPLPGPPSSSDEETETERIAANTVPPERPRPPGAWALTPAPLVRTRSMPPPEQDDSDSQCQSGLATPVASLSRSSSLPTQTPKPPGAWMATPAPRKSILKVRFNPEPSELELSATEDMPSVNGHSEEVPQTPPTGLSTPVEEEGYFRVHTPEPPVPVPASPSKSPRRSPTIRVVDEYGRPDKSKPVKSPKNRNKNPVRIVDAMGREVEAVAPIGKVEIFDDVRLNHNEALRVVREGVTELVQGLDDLDMSGDFVASDLEARLRDLDNASRAAREARDDLKQTYHNDWSAKLRASMQRSKSNSDMQVAVSRRPPSSRMWLWGVIIIVQIIFLFFAYRLQKTSARDLFLTTYYDPFYQDLHLYNIKHDYVGLFFLRAPPSVASLSATLWQDGFKAFVANLVDMADLIFADLRANTWRKWGADDMHYVRWPPT